MSSPSSSTASRPPPNPSGTHNPAEADFLPTRDEMERAMSIEIVDQDNEKLTLGELSKGSRKKRVVLIFIRHFWCTNCQVYTHQLGLSIPPRNLPEGTEVAFIGCGSSAPIKTYTAFTSSPYPVYSCPSLELHKIFKFVRTLQTADTAPKPSPSSSKTSDNKSESDNSNTKASQGNAMGADTSSTCGAGHGGSCSTTNETTIGYLDGVGSETKRIWLSIKNGPFKNFGHYSTSVRGPNDQNGGEMIIEADGSCSFLHRMQNTADHISIEELARAIGAEYVPLSEAERKWPG
ncbi:hypothetical protein I317_06733 [Kwoniella heveanensis CBS 569]|nr:hypothetical protein I317_06733 [Kwoniella heveanensis CBS 569]